MQMQFKRLLALALCFVFLFCALPYSVSEAAAATQSTAKVYTWKQTASQWNTNYSGLSWSKACAVTAIAIQIARTDLVRVDVKAKTFNTNTKTGFNPGSFAKAWRKAGGLSKNAVVTWNSVSNVVKGFVHKKNWDLGPKSGNAFSYFNAGNKQEIIDSMRYYLDKGYYPIVEGPGSGYASNTNSRHYVAVIGVTSNDVRVIDPADGKEKSLFSVQCGKSSKTKWTVGRLDYCGRKSNDDYACCVLYKVNKNALLPTSSATTPCSFTAGSVTSPGATITQGTKFSFTGTVTSAHTIASVTAGIYDSAGKAVQSYTAKPNSKSVDIAQSFGSSLDTSSLAAGTYTYKVTCKDSDGYEKDVTSKTFTVKTPSKITRQPANAAAASGKTVKTSVTAAGDGLTYQWYYKDPGSSKFTKSSATTATYSCVMMDAKSGRQIYCVVKDKYGNSIKSNTVTLSMTATALKIARQPVNAAAASGKTVKTSITAAGDGLTYQWYYKDPGSGKFTKSSATTAAYSCVMTAAKSGRQIYCVVKDKYGNSVKSNTVTLSMTAALKITKQPANAAAALGKTVKTSVTAAGDGLTYQWYVKDPGKSVFTKSSLTTATYSYTMTAAKSGRQVYCMVKDRYGNSVKTRTATLSLP